MDDNKKNVPEDEEELTGKPESELDENTEEPFEETPADNEQPDDGLSAYDKREEYSEGELTGELERLTVLFRDELKKAREAEADADAEGQEEVIQELDEIKEQVEKEIIPEEELCRCCSERRRDTSFGEDYEYCAHCREGMRHYPMGIQYLALALVVTVFAFVSAYLFFTDFNSLYAIRQAEKLVGQGKMTSAVTQYQKAIELFSDDSIVAKRPTLKVTELTYNTIGSFSSAQTLADGLDSLLSPLDYKMPWNRKYYKIRNQLLTEAATVTAYSDISTKYQNEEEPYDAIVKDLETYVGKSLEINAPKASGGLSTLFFGTGAKIETVYDADVIRLLQYIMLQSKTKPEEKSEYMLETQKNSPDRLWLYAYYLGLHYAHAGDADAANALCDKLFAENIENSYGYFLKETIYRASGEFNKSAEIIDEGLKMCGESTEMYRLKAVNQILNGKPKEAVTLLQPIVDGETNLQPSLQALFTYEIAAKEAGDKTTMKKIEGIISENSITYPDVMKAYLNGKKTAKQIFTTGTYDVY